MVNQFPPAYKDSNYTYLNNEKNEKVEVGHSQKLLKEVFGNKGDEVVLCGGNIIILEERNRGNH